jgi:hypothetical protein
VGLRDEPLHGLALLRQHDDGLHSQPAIFLSVSGQFT